MNRKAILALAAACSLAVAFPLTGAAKDKDNDDANAVQDAVVEFGQPQPQGAIAAGTHFLAPEDVTINKGGTVTFVVNGGGHGVGIYPVARRTDRDDIWPDLCNGPTDMTEADRVARSLVCNATAIRNGVTGTENLAYTLTDGKNEIVVLVPSNANGAEPRVDDQQRTLFGTSGRIPGNASANPAGAFLVGTLPAVVTPGNRIQYRFLKTGRYLVVCMNRAHMMNDHMFGFVNVV